MLRYIFSIVGLAFTWALSLLLRVPFWIPIAITSLVAVVLVGMFLWDRIKAKKAANQLEAALAAGQQQTSHLRPDLQAEMVEIEREFREAIGALKSSKVRGGGNALYELPWFAIIGPPGAGKSTAIRNSGLQFPYLSKNGGAVRGIGGTRNCDWWLTNEAVLLDTAGRWSTEDQDRDEWLGFLDMVKRFRPKHPLNGLIVAVPATDLGHAQEHQVQWLAQQIRERVDEVMIRLHMTLPVYVLFTKCDLVPGFIDTFEDMSREERGQLWGFTAPLLQPIDDAGQFFATRFDRLMDVLSERKLRRVAEARRYDQRERIFSFPQQVECLKNNMVHFVSLVFMKNVYQETPLLRGAYFTSGTQEGRPIDMVMQRMAAAFSVQPQAALQSSPTEQKSYFLRDVFQQVLFQDRDISVRSPEERQRAKRVQLIVSGAIMLMATLILSLPTFSWSKNRDLIADSTSVVESVTPNWRPSAALSPSMLEGLRQHVSQLHDPDPFWMGFGMYQGDRLRAPLQNLYGELFRRGVLTPLMQTETQELSSFANRFRAMPTSRPSPAERQTSYRQLKRYLLLSYPQAQGAPPLTGELETWLIGSLSRLWQGAVTVPAGAEGNAERAALRENVTTFLEILQAKPDLGVPHDDNVITHSREALSRVPFAELALYIIEQEQEGRNYGLNLLSILGTSAASLSNAERIPGAYTREAYEARVRRRLDSSPSSFLGDAWVLGSSNSANSAQDAEMTSALKAAYYTRFAQEWREFVLAMSVSTPQGRQATANQIQELTVGQPPPLGRFWQRLAFETSLDDPSANAAAGARAAAGSLGQRVQTRLRSSAAGRALVAGATAENNQAGSQQTSLMDSVVQARDVATAFAPIVAFGVPSSNRRGSAPENTNLDLWHEDLERVRQAIMQNSSYRRALSSARSRINTQVSDMNTEWQQPLRNLLLPTLAGLN